MKQPNQQIIHLAYADYYSIVRKSICYLMSSYGCFSVDIQAGSGHELLMHLKNARTLPDIVLLDIYMPEKNGYETIRELKQLYPSMKFLVLTTSRKEYIISQMIKSGVNGFLLKSCDPDELYRAIHAIYKTGYYLNDLTSKYILGMLQEGENSLLQISKNEMKFLSLCCSDYTYDEIAKMMNLSPRTIHGYRNSLFDKLDIRSRTGLVIFAINIGLAPLQ